MIPTTVTFYGDVGFDRSYNHIIDFSTTTQRNSYFDSKILKTISDCAYNKPMNSIQIRCPYADALEFTYCKFLMGSDVNKSKEIYAWVDDVVLVTDQKVAGTNDYVPILEIKISVDPIQTFMFDFSLGESFVVREHVDRFIDNGDGTKGWCVDNTSSNDNVGFLKRVNEVCELSEEFTLTMNRTFTTRFLWMLIQRVETINGNSVTKMYLIPFSFDNSNHPYFTTNGYMIMCLSDILNDTYLNDLGFDPQTVASVTFIPFDLGEPVVTTVGSDKRLDFNFYIRNEYSGYNYEWTKTNIKRQGSNIYYLGYVYTYGIAGDVLEIERDVEFSGIDYTVATEGDYSPNSEPQLYKEPYFALSIVDEQNINRGNLPSFSVNVANGFKGVTLKILVDTVNVRLRIIPLYVKETPYINITDRFYIEYSLNSIDVIRNNWLSYLLQERETARQMIQSQINQQAIATAINGVSGSLGQGANEVIAGAKSGINMPGVAGGVVAGIGLGMTAINTVGGYVANKHFAFEQQDIREKAIRMKANNIMTSGTFKSNITEVLHIFVVKCDKTTLDIKSKEFHKYGYSVFKYETPNIKTRKYFNFIATNVVKINGNLNNEIKMAIAQVFNNGVTIWHGDYINELTGIGDYSKENIERSLL